MTSQAKQFADFLLNTFKELTDDVRAAIVAGAVKIFGVAPVSQADAAPEMLDSNSRFYLPTENFSRVSTSFTAGVHNGVDLACAMDTPLKAPYSGTVDYAGFDPSGGGNELRLNCDNGLVLKMFHLHQFNCSTGDTVSAGQIVGLSGGLPGAVGAGHSTGPHVHYEIWLKGEPVDPMGDSLGVA